MRKVRIRVRLKIYPVLWTVMIVFALYLLVRFAAISFSHDLGQADFKDALISRLCIQVIRAGHSLVPYTADGMEDSDYFTGSMKGFMELERFVIEDEEIAVRAKSYQELLYRPSSSISDQTNQKKELKKNNYNIYRMADMNYGKEYILSNGAVLLCHSSGSLVGNDNLISNQLSIGYMEGELDDVHKFTSKGGEAVETAAQESLSFTLEQLKDTSVLIRNFYTVDASTTITDTLFDAEKLLGKDMQIEKNPELPQILIYHTHSKEAFIDSRPGREEDTVVGVGSHLADILKEDYGYQVIHDITPYDIVDGKEDRNVAYNQALDGVSKILEDNPGIEVMIDLHRNSGSNKSIELNNKETAQIMLFNGLSRDQNGPITSLDNPNLQNNLAFSLQLQMKARELYPGLFNKNYLKSYRYNMHLRPKCILMELGTVNNTLQSAKNAMAPFAEILDKVLSGE